ncbi:signal peptidase II [Actinosynnema sp. NPDC023587]|uniref:signal peptidase II n=1 Tax=Actinosynnema sp. NPDC023587 TaxID=3154695 RepID=UPI0033D8BF58
MTTTTPSRRLPLVAAFATTVLAVDQATKFWAESALVGRAPVPVLGDLLRLRLLYNPGAAFSLGSGSTWVFTIVAAVAVVVLVRYALRPQPTGRALALALLLGGATTHLLDRLFREPGFARGHVVDFIDYNGWFVGNVADIALTVGAVLLILFGIADPEDEAAPGPAADADEGPARPATPAPVEPDRGEPAPSPGADHRPGPVPERVDPQAGKPERAE